MVQPGGDTFMDRGFQRVSERLWALRETGKNWNFSSTDVSQPLPQASEQIYYATGDGE